LFVPDGERLRPVFVSTGITDGLFTEVSDGISEGDVVVVEAQKQGGSAGGSPMGGQRAGGGPQGGGMRRVGM